MPPLFRFASPTNAGTSLPVGLPPAELFREGRVVIEEALGAEACDVSTAALVLAAGLGEYPGFDPCSHRPDGGELAIEVKGRAGIGHVEMTENEYIQACNLGDHYWHYAVFDCASAHLRLVRVLNPFRKLIVQAKGGVVIDEASIFAHAEQG